MRRAILAVTFTCTLAVLLVGCAAGVTEEQLEQAKKEAHDVGYQQGADDAEKKAQDNLEAIKREMKQKAQEDLEAAKADAVMKAALTIDTPYYTIQLPDEWYGNFTVVPYDSDPAYNPDPTQGHLDGYGSGCRTVIKKKGSAEDYLTVAVLTDNWHPQGSVYGMALGSPSSLPGYLVYVSTPVFDGNSNTLTDMTADCAKYVSLK
ncbi:MAG: hypothetical protein LBG81_03750 [Coriobacteriaceae bacterium]|nr:hypothetical protein [Coriobacteriaceae bacterium]